MAHLFAMEIDCNQSLADRDGLWLFLLKKILASGTSVRLAGELIQYLLTRDHRCSDTHQCSHDSGDCLPRVDTGRLVLSIKSCKCGCNMPFHFVNNRRFRAVQFLAQQTRREENIYTCAVCYRWDTFLLRPCGLSVYVGKLYPENHISVERSWILSHLVRSVAEGSSVTTSSLLKLKCSRKRQLCVY